MSREEHEIDYALTVNVEDATTSIRQLERLLYRTLGLIRRLGLPEEVDAIINKVMRLIAVIRSLQISLNLLFMASGPIGWALAAVGMIASLLSFSDFMMDVG